MGRRRAAPVKVETEAGAVARAVGGPFADVGEAVARLREAVDALEREVVRAAEAAVVHDVGKALRRRRVDPQWIDSTIARLEALRAQELAPDRARLRYVLGDQVLDLARDGDAQARAVVEKAIDAVPIRERVRCLDVWATESADEARRRRGRKGGRASGAKR